MVELLIERGADVNEHAGDGPTLLDRAEENGYEKIAEVLREHGALPGPEDREEPET